MRDVRLSSFMRTIGLAVVLATLAACTGGMSDLQQWVAQEKAKKGPPIPPLPVLKTFETFVYADQDKRDPFGPSLEEQRQANAGANGPVPDKHPKEQLEDFPLDSLKMVGTIGTGARMEGLVKDPNGVIHRVHANNYVGQNNGKITEVAGDRIDLVELIPNGSGGWMKRQASIALGDK
jgi:type IV pilus assembly protein PilP